jgi:hypothetical protein
MRSYSFVALFPTPRRLPPQGKENSYDRVQYFRVPSIDYQAIVTTAPKNNLESASYWHFCVEVNILLLLLQKRKKSEILLADFFQN